ncbi:MAG TPA: Dabb family protein [Candidatus Sulfotelmatobacter sp.]|nr:Dabb family protein [Candidatus Sulfotelmatobacter sp.]
MPHQKRHSISVFAGAVFFLAGIAVGSLVTRSVSALNKFGQPKTVIHTVAYKFRPTTSLNDQQQAIEGIKDMAGKIPGIKNIWLKTERNQIRDFDGVYVIEFASPEAAADYAESPVHDAWRKKWEQLRENSLSFQASN